VGGAVIAGPRQEQARCRKVAPATRAAKSDDSIAGLSAKDFDELSARFEKELWPVMTSAESGCTSCHGQKNTSQFVISPTSARDAFQKMFLEGHFDEANHGSSIARITTTDKNIKMPPRA
jgi:hypothetical protein